MPDMITPKSGEFTVAGLKGFFEAPWRFKRKGTYYLAFADNDAATCEDCSPSTQCGACREGVRFERADRGRTAGLLAIGVLPRQELAGRNRCGELRHGYRRLRRRSF